MMRVVLAVLAFAWLPALALVAQEKQPPTTIILVRHAEKDTMKIDPPLKPKGRERAQLLSRMLRESGARSTHSTQYRRTSETVAPLDSLLGITNEVIDADPDSLAAHAAGLVRHLLSAHKGETTVVASHSNVIPLLMQALGIAAPVEIGDADYDNVFIITVGPGAQPALLRLRMGMR